MKVESIDIQGYRSLYNVHFDPGDLTVLTGPNNSGKTNLVEAIDFLGEVHRHGIEIAVSRKGGYENIAHRRMRRTRLPIAIDIHASVRLADLEPWRFVPAGRRRGLESPIFLRHRFEISALGQAIEADFQVTTEILQLTRQGEAKPFIQVLRYADVVKIEAEPSSGRHDDVTYPFGLADFADYVTRSARRTELLLTVISINPVVRGFSDTMSRTRLYQLVPIEGRRPGVPTPNADLARHGGNLPALVAFMKRQNPRAWARVIEAMRRIVPGLEDVRTDFTPDRRLALQFVESGLRRPWSAEDISDGTIQGLAMFSALFDPRSPLLLVEEPENSVHPWVIRTFVDACREVQGKQIVVTTHSPALINYLTPNEVVVVWRREGRTQVRPLLGLDQGVQELWASGKATVFELLDSGRLSESVPGEPE